MYSHTALQSQYHNDNVTYSLWASNISVFIVSRLSPPEAKPEKPAWYERILQIIYIYFLQGKWLYKNVHLIPLNKIWVLAQGGYWTVSVESWEQSRSRSHDIYPLAKFRAEPTVKHKIDATQARVCIWSKNKYELLINVQLLLVKFSNWWII